jgi:hypothetical protein
MNKRIFKYSLVKYGFEKSTTLHIPKGGEVLTVQRDEKNNQPSLWILVDPDADLEERTFELFGAGDDVGYDMGIERNYIGTYQYQKGEFIGHVFERIN